MKYVLIDGNNVAIRSAFANEQMTSTKGDPTGAHFGFFNSLLSMKEKYPDHQYLIAWDGKSARRMEESQKGKEASIIPELYKENRTRGEKRQPLLDWFAQGDFLKRALGATGIPQIRIQEYEADDVIASYSRQLSRDGHEVVLATSDRDFYQLLDKNVKIWDGLKIREFTDDDIRDMYGVEPKQLIDVGALMGDNGDNIFGIPGWGEKTSIAAIKKSGSWQAVLQERIDKYDSYRTDYPDYNDDRDNNSDIDEIKMFLEYKIAETATGKLVYPEIYWGQPYSGLLDAFEMKALKIPKRDLMALMFKDRVALAYSLKQMDDEIQDLPDITNLEQNKEKLLEYFEYYDIRSIVKKAEVFFA